MKYLESIFDICYKDIYFKYIWLLILLSFAFYIPVVLFSSRIPGIGMFMLPKTICYILMIFIFKNICLKENIKTKK